MNLPSSLLHDDKPYVNAWLSPFPVGLQKHLVKQFEGRRRGARSGERVARSNRLLRSAAESLGAPVGGVDVVEWRWRAKMLPTEAPAWWWDDVKVRLWAEGMASGCELWRMYADGDELTALAELLALAHTYGRGYGAAVYRVARQAKKGIAGALARASNPAWWRRTARTVVRREIEGAARNLGAVCQSRQVYASDDAVSIRRAQRARNTATLSKLQVVEQGAAEGAEGVPLSELVEASIANPKHRRAELLARVAGLERYHDEDDREWLPLFVTITAPSRYHSHRRRGQANPKWRKGGRVRVGDAQRYLMWLWNLIMTKTRREHIACSGLRVAEPHHDGTPHLHAIAWVEVGRAGEWSQMVEQYARREDGQELDSEQAKTARALVKPVPVDGEGESGAVGYIVKYVSKNIDGAALEVGQDLEAARPAVESAERVAAWAACHGIRQFQPFGGVKITAYRELRRVKVRPGHGPMVELWAAADAGDLAQYQRVIDKYGSPELIRRPKEYNQYWEEVDGRVKGVALGLEYLETRPALYEIRPVVNSASELVKTAEPWGASINHLLSQERAESARLTLSGSTLFGPSAPWAGVNNSTGEEHGRDDRRGAAAVCRRGRKSKADGRASIHSDTEIRALSSAENVGGGGASGGKSGFVGGCSRAGGTASRTNYAPGRAGGGAGEGYGGV